MPAISQITINFDTGVNSVFCVSGGLSGTVYASGDTVNCTPSQNINGTIHLNDGYKVKSVVSTNSGNLTVTDNKFTYIPNNGDVVTITTKLAVNKVSIDLTTLTGWDNVTPGEHTIQVVAKATGYLDSAKSAPITFTKASATTGETWVLNSSLNLTNFPNSKINFTSAGVSYIGLYSIEDMITEKPYLDYVQTYNPKIDIPDLSTQVYANATWVDDKYRTITFNSPVIDSALLTWLQANGTKQGGTTTAHKLTWSDSTMLVTVNGNAATSPYTLANGDTIVLKRTSGWQSINVITDTGSVDTDSTQSPLAVSNSDIKLQNGNVDMSPSMKFSFTINYEENANSGGNIQ